MASTSALRFIACCRIVWTAGRYWDAAKQGNEIGRAQDVTAAFNGIVRQLRRAGGYEEMPSL
jgi:hypothetical protein